MENQSKKRGVGALITGTILTGALMSVSVVNANEMFNYNDLGSGAELRSELLDASNTGMKALEATCGEKKAEGKSTDHKCGEGKCGEKADKKGEAKSTGDSKASDHKCGEGKCGEKTDKKADKKSESKSSEHKCGEGKCGESKK